MVFRSLTGMYVENPGADMFKNQVYMVSTKNSAAGMRDAIKKMAPLAVKACEKVRKSVLLQKKDICRTVFV